MILLLHKIDILTNKTFIEERNIRKKVTKFSSHDEVTHFDGIDYCSHYPSKQDSSLISSLAFS